MISSAVQVYSEVVIMGTTEMQVEYFQDVIDLVNNTGSESRSDPSHVIYIDVTPCQLTRGM